MTNMITLGMAVVMICFCAGYYVTQWVRGRLNDVYGDDE